MQGNIPHIKAGMSPRYPANIHKRTAAELKEKELKVAVTVLRLDPRMADDSVMKLNTISKTPREKALKRRPMMTKDLPYVPKEKSILEFGLKGTGCFQETVKTEILPKEEVAVEPKELPKEQPKVSTELRPELPIIPRQSAKSENSMISSIHRFSYLDTDFGFKNSKSDALSDYNLPTSRRMFRGQNLEKRLAVQAKRHIDACSTVGMVRKSSRAAQSVQSLKQTMGEYSSRAEKYHEIESHLKDLSDAICVKLYSRDRCMLKQSKLKTDTLPMIGVSSCFAAAE